MRWTLVLVLVWWPAMAAAQDAETPAAQHPAAQHPAPQNPAPQNNEPAGPELTSVEDAPALDAQHAEPGQPIYEAWWFWVGIGAIVIGITLTIAIDLTTADPSPGDVGVVLTTLRF